MENIHLNEPTRDLPSDEKLIRVQRDHTAGSYSTGATPAGDTLFDPAVLPQQDGLVERTISVSSTGKNFQPRDVTEFLRQYQEQQQQILEAAVEEDMKEWLEHWRNAHPNGILTTVEEVEVRQLYTQLEAKKLGIPFRSNTTTEIAALDKRLWEVKDFQNAMKGSSQKPPEIVHSLVLEQSATLISAHPHGIKSLSWLQAAIEAVAKKIVWGHFPAPNVTRTLFIETEDPPWLVEARIRWIANGLGLKGDDILPGFHYVCPGPFDLVKKEQELRDLIRKSNPDFVVLSTLQNVLGGRDWKEADQIADVMAVIIRLCRGCCPIVVITHSPWDKKQRRAAGSVTLTANFPTTLHYEKFQKKDETNVNVLLDSKVGTEPNFYLKLVVEPDPSDDRNPRSLNLIYGGKGWSKGSGREAVVAAIEERPDASAKEIAKLVGVSDRHVRGIKNELSTRKKNARNKSPQHPSGDGDEP